MTLLHFFTPLLGECTYTEDKKADLHTVTLTGVDVPQTVIITCNYHKTPYFEWVDVKWQHEVHEKDLMHEHYPWKSIQEEVEKWVKEESIFRILFLYREVELRFIRKLGITYQNEHYNKPIDTLGLSVRPLNILKQDGYTKIGDLQTVTHDYLAKRGNLGDRSRKEIKNVLLEWGFWSE